MGLCVQKVRSGFEEASRARRDQSNGFNALAGPSSAGVDQGTVALGQTKRYRGRKCADQNPEADYPCFVTHGEGMVAVNEFDEQERLSIESRSEVVLNPLYAAVIAAVLGHERKCAACGYEQIVDKLTGDGKYHCKKCSHVFTREELKGTAKPE